MRYLRFAIGIALFVGGLWFGDKVYGKAGYWPFVILALAMIAAGVILTMLNPFIPIPARD
jgi:hypothetical protein